jgi:hypothetical protein
MIMAFNSEKVAKMVEMKNAFYILIETPIGRRHRNL